MSRSKIDLGCISITAAITGSLDVIIEKKLGPIKYQELPARIKALIKDSINISKLIQYFQFYIKKDFA